MTIALGLHDPRRRRQLVRQIVGQHPYHGRARILPEGRQQQQRRADDEGGEGDVEFDRAELVEQLRQREQHIGERRDEQRAAAAVLRRAAPRSKFARWR